MLPAEPYQETGMTGCKPSTEVAVECFSMLEAIGRMQITSVIVIMLVGAVLVNKAVIGGIGIDRLMSGPSVHFTNGKDRLIDGMQT
jgi:hypothetical protein